MADGTLQLDLAYLYRLAYALTSSEHDAADLAQSAVVKAWTHLERIQHSRRGYLRRVLINLHTDQLRRRAIVQIDLHPDMSDHSVVSDRFAATDTRLDVAAALRTIPGPLRQVLVLRYIEDLTPREIAELVNRTASTVRRQIIQGLDLLATQLPRPRPNA